MHFERSVFFVVLFMVLNCLPTSGKFYHLLLIFADSLKSRSGPTESWYKLFDTWIVLLLKKLEKLILKKSQQTTKKTQKITQYAKSICIYEHEFIGPVKQNI